MLDSKFIDIVGHEQGMSLIEKLTLEGVTFNYFFEKGYKKNKLKLSGNKYVQNKMVNI